MTGLLQPEATRGSAAPCRRCPSQPETPWEGSFPQGNRVQVATGDPDINGDSGEEKLNLATMEGPPKKTSRPVPGARAAVSPGNTSRVPFPQFLLIPSLHGQQPRLCPAMGKSPAAQLMRAGPDLTPLHEHGCGAGAGSCVWHKEPGHLGWPGADLRVTEASFKGGSHNGIA